MKISPLAGKPAEQNILVNIPRLVTAYYTGIPDIAIPDQRVAFGTSGHRGSSFPRRCWSPPMLGCVLVVVAGHKI